MANGGILKFYASSEMLGIKSDNQKKQYTLFASSRKRQKKMILGVQLGPPVPDAEHKAS